MLPQNAANTANAASKAGRRHPAAGAHAGARPTPASHPHGAAGSLAAGHVLFLSPIDRNTPDIDHGAVNGSSGEAGPLTADGSDFF